MAAAEGDAGFATGRAAFVQTHDRVGCSGGVGVDVGVDAVDGVGADNRDRTTIPQPHRIVVR